VGIKEMKDIDFSLAVDVLRRLPGLFEGDKDAYSTNEEAEFRFVLKMLKSPFLEKRLKGINELKDFTTRIPSADLARSRDGKDAKMYEISTLLDVA
jgi:hypothetical protein